MPPHDPAHPPFASSADLSARVGDIVRAAEREARAVEQEIAARRRAAEASARRYELEVRRQTDALAHQRLNRLRSLTDDLAARAQEIRDRLDGLLAAIAEASEAVSLEPGKPSPRSLGRRRLEPVEPVRIPRHAPDVDAARLVTVELAVAGRSRVEAERHLREAFGLTDPTGLLDDVYGSEPTREGIRPASGLS